MLFLVAMCDKVASIPDFTSPASRLLCDELCTFIGTDGGLQSMMVDATHLVQIRSRLAALDHGLLSTS